MADLIRITREEYFNMQKTYELLNIQLHSHTFPSINSYVITHSTSPVSTEDNDTVVLRREGAGDKRENAAFYKLVAL